MARHGLDEAMASNFQPARGPFVPATAGSFWLRYFNLLAMRGTPS